MSGGRANLSVLVLVLSTLGACAATEAPSTDDSSSGRSGTGPSGDGGAGNTATGDGGKSGSGLVGAPCATKADCDSSLKLNCLTELPAVPLAGFPGKTYPGGFCTRACGTPDPDSSDPAERELSTDCGAGGRCQSSSQSSGGGTVSVAMCVKACQSDADCRAAEGYTCKANLLGLKNCEP